MTDQTLLGSYAYGPIVLSVLIAILASYTALDLAGRATASGGRARLGWLVAGVTSMGIGIWFMHFIGMLAFSLPVSIQYDWPIVLLSLLAGIFRLCSLPLCRQQAKDGTVARPFGQRLYGWSNRGSALHCHGFDAPRG
jgi:NO-binding membrane sensor protein with MHYT domain